MENKDDKILVIFSGKLWESEMVTSLLKNEGIESFLQNSTLSTYAYNPVYSQEVKVMVFAANIERAEQIVKDYLSNQK